MTTSPRSSTLIEPDDEPMVWHGWGDPSHRSGLPAGAERFLTRRIGPLGPPSKPVALDDVDVPDPRLSDAQRSALVAAVGPDHVRDDRRTRVEHAGGKSYPDLLRRRSGDATGAPDAVVAPADHREVRAVLDACVRERVAVVPFGGGTSVVGGVEPERGPFGAVIALDLRRLRRLVDLDEVSHVARLEAGLRGPQAEALLRRRGWTLGHFPQSYAYATIGGYAATRSAGQSSSGYGRFDDLVVGVRCATPAGDLDLGRAPASAAGPDLRALVVGSEGVLGVVTEVAVRIHPAPAVERYEGWVVGSFPDGVRLLRALEQERAAPDVTRLSDPGETAVALASAGGAKGRAVRAYLRARRAGAGCLVLLGWDGSEDRIARRRAEALRVVRRHGAVRLGTAAGRSWARGRFEGPYLRDELLDRGVLVETLETATAWSRLEPLYEAVGTALRDVLEGRGTPPLVLCHVSHVYATGASLYFTWIARQETGAELGQWHAAKIAATDAIVAAGGTITHHHAVGTDHRPWMHHEIGELGVEVLRAVKARLDPVGILNPGKLIPPVGGPGALPLHRRASPS